MGCSCAHMSRMSHVVQPVSLRTTDSMDTTCVHTRSLAPLQNAIPSVLRTSTPSFLCRLELKKKRSNATTQHANVLLLVHPKVSVRVAGVDHALHVAQPCFLAPRLLPPNTPRICRVERCV